MDAKYKVTIEEKLEVDGEIFRNYMCPSSTQYRKKKNAFLIKQIKTVYPFGLNWTLGLKGVFSQKPEV